MLSFVEEVKAKKGVSRKGKRSGSGRGGRRSLSSSAAAAAAIASEEEGEEGGVKEEEALGKGKIKQIDVKIDSHHLECFIYCEPFGPLLYQVEGRSKGLAANEALKIFEPNCSIFSFPRAFSSSTPASPLSPSAADTARPSSVDATVLAFTGNALRHLHHHDEGERHPTLRIPS